MQNINQPFYPQYTQAYQPQQPTSSVGAVNIQIFNPTANPQPAAQGFYQPMPCACYPCNYNNMTMQTPQPSASNQINNQTQMLNRNMNLENNQQGVAASGNGEEGQATKSAENANNQGPKVALTDDYIRTLENYLNSQDKKIRLMGAKELFERFKEDKTRRDDAALTALLNKALQDPAETVKFMALTTLDTGYATGNNETAQILSNMQNSTSSYGEDAAMASKILLKMSGNKANMDAGTYEQNYLSDKTIETDADKNKTNDKQQVALAQNAGGEALSQNVKQIPDGEVAIPKTRGVAGV